MDTFTAAARGIGQRLDALPVSSFHYKIILVLAAGTFFELYEVFLTGILSTTLKAEFKVAGPALSLILASSLIGAFLGAALVAPLADRIGRRNAFMVTVATYSVFTLVAAFSPNETVLVIARFLAGVGMGGEIPVVSAFFVDLLPPKQRGRLTAIAFTVAYTAAPVVGFLSFTLAPASPLGVAGWRWVFALGALGAVAAALMRRGLPESPRWLASVGRIDEADRIVADFERQARVAQGRPPVQTDAPSVPAPARADLKSVVRPPFRRRFLLLSASWGVVVIGWSGFGTLAALSLESRGFATTGTLLFVSLTFLGYPLGSLLSIPLLDRFERKWIVAVSIAVMGALGASFGLSTSSVGIVVAGFTYTLVSNVLSNALNAYTFEQFPTNIRASACGWIFSLGRLSAALSPFYLVAALSAWGPSATFIGIACVMALISAGVVAFGIRTTGYSVEKITRST